MAGDFEYQVDVFWGDGERMLTESSPSPTSLAVPRAEHRRAALGADATLDPEAELDLVTETDRSAPDA